MQIKYIRNLKIINSDFWYYLVILTFIKKYIINENFYFQNYNINRENNLLYLKIFYLKFNNIY